ncbi:DUF5999 family protein [Microbispora siamensis]|uniref:Uncharacterized protein n=1 Tax=Microbispora siamensis TaxID=564413 RepID=A0ABQ4GT14_9ACTN|nr:DUF5999 family protein [Microbispora siamensis]GIH64533.1 hypothetical protein Msi02_53500 [Microbispora siamensis]
MCRHPQCPPANAPDRDAACLIACHLRQGRGRLGNGMVLCYGSGELTANAHSSLAREFAGCAL